MNNKDMKIIASLRKDARMPLTKMSRETRIPVSTLFDRLKMNEEGAIIRHTSLLNFRKLGYNARANIAIKVDREDKEAVKEFLVKSIFVNSVYKINNGFDFMIEGIFKQIQNVEEFIEKLEEKFRIIELKEHFIIEDLKKEGFMTNSELLMLHD